MGFVTKTEATYTPQAYSPTKFVLRATFAHIKAVPYDIA